MITNKIELDTEKSSSENDSEKKVHPWRLCPSGKHYVRTHDEHVKLSKTHPNGETVVRHAHCANNPSHKDMLSFDEIHAITEKYFSNLTGTPTAGILIKYGQTDAHFLKADDYDYLIRGWVYYWNTIFKPINPLDPNLIKALMATESSFNEKSNNIVLNKNKKIHARGLLQITEETWHVLGNHHGELHNYLIELKESDLFDPSANIYGGIRWLFRKKEIASTRLKREATWEEAIIDYKSYRGAINKNKPVPALNHLRDYYNQLQGK